MHHFNFEYRDTLMAPWYSGLAQGQGISVLIRAYKETGDQKYAKAIKDAFASLDKNMILPLGFSDDIIAIGRVLKVQSIKRSV